MNQTVPNTLFALLRTAVCGAPLPDFGGEPLPEELVRQIWALDKRHDMAHLAGEVLLREQLLPPDSPEAAGFERQRTTAVFRYAQLNAELERICAVLERAEIPHLPLKGSVLRRLYPEPWMRTSCDIDVLVRREQLEAAADALVAQLSYRKEALSSHDLPLFSPGGVHLELHYDLIEERMDERAAGALLTVWESASLQAGCRYRYEMSDEMFYFYHIAHMAKHFQNGGCGIRPLLDLWILDNRVTPRNPAARDALLEQGGLLPFATAARQLSHVWFDGAQPDDLTRQMEQFILFGGVYGTEQNRITVQHDRKGGKLRYILSRIFMPYDSLVFLYPVLRKHKWLLPVCEVRRWLRLLQPARAKRTMRELHTSQHIDRQQVESTAAMMRRLGL